MGKNCGRGNKQLGTKVLAAKNVAEGEAGAKNFLKLAGLDLSLKNTPNLSSRSLYLDMNISIKLK